MAERTASSINIIVRVLKRHSGVKKQLWKGPLISKEGGMYDNYTSVYSMPTEIRMAHVMITLQRRKKNQQIFACVHMQ